MQHPPDYSNFILIVAAMAALTARLFETQAQKNAHHDFLRSRYVAHMRRRKAALVAFLICLGLQFYLTYLWYMRS
jgi:hypothetical protein